MTFSTPLRLKKPARSARLALCLGWSLLSMVAPARAEETKGAKPKPSAEDLAWIDEIASLPPGELAEFKPLVVYFDLSWNNVLFAGELAVAVDRTSNAKKSGDADALIGRAAGRSTGLARVLWPYDVEAQGLTDPQSLRPHLFELSEVEREKAVDYVLDFQPGKVISTTTATPKKKGDAPETKSRNYRFEGLQDILSTAFYLRSQPLHDGDTVKALVSPFNRPYYVEFKTLGREKRKVQGETYDTIKLDVKIRKVNADKTLQDYDKMKKATIWLTDDDFRLPLEVHADIFIGFVSARMRERAWLSPKQADGTATIPASEKKGFLESAGSALFGSKEKPDSKVDPKKIAPAE